MKGSRKREVEGKYFGPGLALCYRGTIKREKKKRKEIKPTMIMLDVSCDSRFYHLHILMTFLSNRHVTNPRMERHFYSSHDIIK